MDPKRLKMKMKLNSARVGPSHQRYQCKKHAIYARKS